MLYYRPSVESDILEVADNIRPEDEREVLAGGKTSVEESLESGFFSSDPVYSIVVSGEETPLAMFGVVPRQHAPGSIWMLATKDLPKYAMSFLKRSTEVVNYLQTFHPVVSNYVDSRNHLHIRWLEWTGFVFLQEGDIVVNGTVFHYFVRTKQCAIPS